MIKDGKTICDACGDEFSPQPTEAEKEEKMRKREEEERAGRVYKELCVKHMIPGISRLFG